MAYTVTMTEPEKTINNNGDTLQTIFVLSNTAIGVSTEWDMDDLDIVITDHGSLEWKYDLEDTLLTPGTIRMSVYDGGSIIYYWLFVMDCNPRFKVTLKLNGETEFIGHVLEDSFVYNIGLKTIELTVKPRIDNLINAATYGPDDELLDPIEYTSGDTENISNATYNSGEVTITHNANGQFSAGATVLIEDVVGMTDINGYHLIASKVDNTQFKLTINTIQIYSSGGTVTLIEGGYYTSLYQMIRDIFQLVNANIKYWLDNLTVKSTLTDATNLNAVREVALTSNENYAVLCSYANDAVTIIDISDLDNPVLAGTVSDGTNLNEAYDLVLTSDDNYAVVVARVEARLTIVDISDPTSPIVVGNIQDANMSSVRGVAITSDDNYAVCCGHDDDSVVIIDISDKTTPTVVGTLTDDYLEDVTHVAITSDDTYAVCTSGISNAIIIIDISTPASPSITGVCIDADLGDGDGNDIILTSDDNYAIVNGKGVNSLVIVDISTPTYPVVRGSIIDAVNLTDTRILALTSDENYVIVTLAGDDQITIVDITIKCDPRVVGSLSDSDLNSPIGIALTSNNDYAIIAANVGDACTVVNLYAAGTLKIDQNWLFNTTPSDVLATPYKNISAAEYTELLDQGDCEAGDGIPEINGQDLRVQACTIAQSAAQKHGGANSCKITSDGITASNIRVRWNQGDYDGYLEEEKAHIIEVWVYLPSGNSDITEIYLGAKDIDNNNLIDSTTDTDNWTKLSLTMQSITDDEDNAIKIYTNANGDETAEFFYIDDFSIKPKTILTITHAVQAAMFAADDFLMIEDVIGMTDLNGFFRVESVPDNTHFTINLYTTQTYTSDGIIKLANIRKFEDIYQSVDSLFYDPTKNIVSAGDVLKKLAIDWFCYTGMIHEQKAFFNKLFHYDENNLQTLGTVLKNNIKYEYPLIKYVKMKTDITYDTYYIAGNYTSNEKKRIIRDTTLPGFWVNYEGAGTVAGTNIKISGGELVFAAMDSDVSDIYNAFFSNGYLLTELWYNNRSDINKCRLEMFIVKGIDYDFLKNFIYNEHKYQIMRLRKNWSKNETEIDAINLGGV